VIFLVLVSIATAASPFKAESFSLSLGKMQFFD
jgi:hypothetical protein